MYFFKKAFQFLGKRNYENRAVNESDYSSITSSGISVLKESLLVMDFVNNLSNKLCFLDNMANKSGFL